MKGYTGHIEQETVQNEHFRRVLWTGEHMQLVVMSIQVGEEIGVETHEHVDQFFRIEQGKAIVVMDGEETEVEENDGFIVPSGVEHNVINRGEQTLKLYTIYSPANHIDGTVHKTKEDADNDEADEAFGHAH